MNTKEVYNALTLGIRDYFKKNNFTKAVIGLSGGIDSSVATYLVVKALGKDQNANPIDVHTVLMEAGAVIPGSERYIGALAPLGGLRSGCEWSGSPAQVGRRGSRDALDRLARRRTS